MKTDEYNNSKNVTPLSGQAPFITDRKQLADPAVLKQFSNLVREIVRADNREQAIEGRFVLEDMLLGEYPQLATENREIYNQYQEQIALLKFVVLSARPLPEIEKLLRDYSLLALRSGIPVQLKLQEVLDVYNDILMEGKIAESLAKAFLSSAESLGQESLLLKGTDNTVSPTIGNWIRDYLQSSSPSLDPDQRPGSIERISYFNQSPNVRKLSKDVGDLLLRMIELYDWLRFGSSTRPPEPESSYMVAAKFTVPTPPRPVPKKQNIEYGILNLENGIGPEFIQHSTFDIQFNPNSFLVSSRQIINNTNSNATTILRYPCARE
mgnify:CR=1 FL=1